MGLIMRGLLAYSLWRWLRPRRVELPPEVKRNLGQKLVVQISGRPVFRREEVSRPPMIGVPLSKKALQQREQLIKGAFKRYLHLRQIIR